MAIKVLAASRCYKLLVYTHTEANNTATGNVFWKSLAWKRGLIQDVAMLPRSEMYKPPSDEATEIKMNAAFTDIQESKQVT